MAAIVNRVAKPMAAIVNRVAKPMAGTSSTSTLMHVDSKSCRRMFRKDPVSKELVDGWVHGHSLRDGIGHTTKRALGHGLGLRVKVRARGRTSKGQGMRAKKNGTLRTCRRAGASTLFRLCSSRSLM